MTSSLSIYSGPFSIHILLQPVIRIQRNKTHLFVAGKSTSGINEEIIWISISMAIAIAVLIAIALCYILKEKCSKRQAYKEQSWRYKEEFAKHALTDSLNDFEFPSYTLYPQYSPDGKEYFYNFHRFTYLRDSFKLPPKDYPMKEKEIYINAWYRLLWSYFVSEYK